MNLTQLISHMRHSPMFSERITAWHAINDVATLRFSHVEFS
jgi:hypothetical protein